MRGKHLLEAKINEIKNLRLKGHSLLEISKTIQIPKTTVYSYIKDIIVEGDYLRLLKQKRNGSKKRKFLAERKATEYSKRQIKSLSKKEKILFISALYWAEGSKKDFSLSNTDPNLIKIFVTGLREIFNISNKRLRVSIRIYEDLNREDCLNYWSKIIGLPKERFINVNILKGKKSGKLSYGMCRIRVSKAGDLLKKIKSINNLVTDIFVPIA